MAWTLARGASVGGPLSKLCPGSPPLSARRTRWVDSVDDAAARAPELGGTTVVAPFATPVGRSAVLADGAGAAFTVTTIGA